MHVLFRVKISNVPNFLLECVNYNGFEMDVHTANLYNVCKNGCAVKAVFGNFLHKSTNATQKL